MDDWQLECCGEPFSIGDRVSWTVVVPDAGYLSDVLGEEADDIGYAEEHHSDSTDLQTITGVVRLIQAMHCRFLPSQDNPRLLCREAGSGVLVVVDMAAGREESPPGLGHCGYLIELA